MNQFFQPKHLLQFIFLITVLALPSACKEDHEVPIPAISDVSPDEGIVDSRVTITGTHFSATATDNTVKFNGTVASVINCSATSIVVKVPSGATTGPVTVTVEDRGTAISPEDFV